MMHRDAGRAPSSGPSGHLLPVGEKSWPAFGAISSPLLGEGGERSEPGEGATLLPSGLTSSEAARSSSPSPLWGGDRGGGIARTDRGATP